MTGSGGGAWDAQLSAGNTRVTSAKVRGSAPAPRLPAERALRTERTAVSPLTTTCCTLNVRLLLPPPPPWLAFAMSAEAPANGLDDLDEPYLTKKQTKKHTK